MWRSFFNNHLHQNTGGNRQHCPKDDVKVVDGISDLVFIIDIYIYIVVVFAALTPKTSDYHCSPGRIHCRLVSPTTRRVAGRLLASGTGATQAVGSWAFPVALLWIQCVSYVSDVSGTSSVLMMQLEDERCSLWFSPNHQTMHKSWIKRRTPKQRAIWHVPTRISDWSFWNCTGSPSPLTISPPDFLPTFPTLAAGRSCIGKMRRVLPGWIRCLDMFFQHMDPGSWILGQLNLWDFHPRDGRKKKLKISLATDSTLPRSWSQLWIIL